MAEYRINIQKSIFLHISNEQCKSEIKKAIPLTVEPKNKSCSIKVIIKGVKDLYAERSKALARQILKDVNKWKDIQCS